MNTSETAALIVASLLIVVGLLTLATYAARALRWQFHLTAPVRANLSVIGALLLVVIAGGYQLDIAELAYSVGGPRCTPSRRSTSRRWSRTSR